MLCYKVVFVQKFKNKMMMVILFLLFKAKNQGIGILSLPMLSEFIKKFLI
jgi:hypothetical protein